VRAPAETSMTSTCGRPQANIADTKEQAIDEIAMTLASAGSQLSRFTVEGKHIPPHLLSKVRTLGERYNSGHHDKPEGSNGQLIKDLGLLGLSGRSLRSRWKAAGLYQEA
jgi:hypothetical protein